MGWDTKTIDYDDLPGTIPVFPLPEVLLLPRGQLPLNIFEKRYLSMVDHAMRTHRMIGMVQPDYHLQKPSSQADDANAHDDKERLIDNTTPLHKIGCAGRITSYEETEDGRYLITLTGVCRFRIIKEISHPGVASKIDIFRQAKAAWGGFEADLHPVGCLDLDKKKLMNMLKRYFDQEGLTCSWDTVENAPDEKLITCLAMICPFGAVEKQALLESRCCQERAYLFMSLLEMALGADEKGIEIPRTCH